MPNIFELYKASYEDAVRRMHLSESVDPAQIQAQTQGQVDPNSGNLEYEYDPAVDEDDSIPSIGHPANHPAVHAAHSAFLEAHNALADDPTPENLEIFEKYFQNLKEALIQYVFPQIDPSYAQQPQEEVEGEESEEVDEEEGEEQPQAEEDGEEEEEEEEAPPRKKESYYRESQYMKQAAQSGDDVSQMNSLDAYQNVSILYNSESEDPWTITQDGVPLASFSDKEQAESALAQWSSEALDEQPMDGMEEEYSDDLLPDAPDDIEASYEDVIGDEEQDFDPPQVDDAASYRESRFVEEVGQFRESLCPMCSGHGFALNKECECCDGIGKVTPVRAHYIREALEEHAVAHEVNNNIFGGYGTNKQVEYTGNYHPSDADDPMTDSYNQILQARSRR